MKLARMLTKNKHLTSINLYNNQDIDTNGLLALIDSLNSVKYLFFVFYTKRRTNY